MAGPKDKPSFFCGLCGSEFSSKIDLTQHMQNHADTITNSWGCKACLLSFDDQLALEAHMIVAGHRDPLAKTDEALQVWCDNSGCPERGGPFSSRAEFIKHKQFPSTCSDAFKPKKTRKGDDGALTIQPAPLPVRPMVDRDAATVSSSLRGSLGHHSTEPDEGYHCPICKRTFRIQASYNNHFLRCEPPPGTAASQQPVPDTANDWAAALSFKPTNANYGSRASANAARKYSRKKKSSRANARKDFNGSAQRAESSVKVSKESSVDQVMAPVSEAATTAPFKCTMIACGRSFRSEAGLNAHQMDVHGIGGKALDMEGEDSWRLNQRVREKLKEAGLLRQPRVFGPSPSAPRNGSGIANNQHVPPSPVSAPVIQKNLGIPSMGGPEDMQQAEEIYGKILRLGLQSDVVIHHTGKITCGEIDWIRIPVAKQVDVARKFDELCHLPKILQSGEYFPVSRTFKDEYKVQCAVNDFEHSPESSLKPTIAVLALSCIKVLMANGTQDVVKIAAVDVCNGRILMNHLVCSDPSAAVKDWRTEITGLTSYNDIEAARADGYKVFKGWNAARAALWKFIDKETIIVGHNLRGDMDALRMIHGRAVDVVKTVEKAANGPLSKLQLSLETLSRDLASKHLSCHPSFGRDPLQNAFAIRELGLWMIKNEDKMTKWAKQKSLDYQRIADVTRA